MIYTFGKHKGKNIKDVFEDNPDYVRWSFYNVEWFRKQIESLDFEFSEVIRESQRQKQRDDRKRWNNIVCNSYKSAFNG